MNSLISVIVPVYNAEPFLIRCIDSIINQTYTNLEIILINDESPDNSGAICDEYAKNDNRVIVIHQTNIGPGGARNEGVKIAKGEYIAFVDADDYLDLSAYEKLITFMLENDLDIALFNHYKVKEQKIIYPPKQENQFFTKEEALNAILKYEISPVIWDKIYKSNIAKKVCFPLYRTLEDLSTTFKYFEHAEKIAYLKTPLYYYNQDNPNSIMTLGAHSPRMYFNHRYNDFLAHKERWLFAKNYPLKEIAEHCYYVLITVALEVTEAVYDSKIDLDDIKVKEIEGFLKKISKQTYKKLSLRRKLLYHSFLNNKKIHKTVVSITKIRL